MLTTFIFLSIGIVQSQNFSSKLDSHPKGLTEIGLMIMPVHMNLNLKLRKDYSQYEYEILKILETHFNERAKIN